MELISIKFFVFLLMVAIAYYIIPLSKRWLVLLSASVIFFIVGCDPKLFLVFILQVLVAYVASHSFKKFPKQGKWICRIIVTTELGSLIAWKESSFFIINLRILNQILGINKEIPYLELVAPLAISYYSLMLVSYILDVYWKKIEPEKNPLKLVLYASFFPQMVAGPFTRYGEMGGLFEGHRLEYRNIAFAAQRILWGLFKKLVIAERLGVIVNTIYGGGLEGTWTPTGVYIWLGAITYVFQVYTDFSGGIDIVLGVAQLFGIILPENFQTPFYSTGLAEFWRRWHTTLGLWLKDYIMYPFLMSKWAEKLRAYCKERWGKNASKTIPTYIGTLFVWLYCGFWHGGSYKWIFWGLLTFVIIVGGKILQPTFDRIKMALRINTQAASWTLFERLRTTVLFMITVSVQPAESLSVALQMWKNAFVFNPWVLVDGSLYTLGLDYIDFWIMIYGLLTLFVISKYQQKGSAREIIAQQNLVFRWLLWITLFVAVFLFGMYGEGYDASTFIYGGF